VAKQLAKEILGDENKVEFVEVTSKTRIPLLNKGDIDAIIATMTITEERRKEVDFTEVYFEAGQSLLVKKGSPVQSIDDLTKDTTVLAVKGSTSTDNIRAAVPDAPVLEFEKFTEEPYGIAVKKGEQEFLDALNDSLETIKANGDFDTVYNSWFDGLLK